MTMPIPESKAMEPLVKVGFRLIQAVEDRKNFGNILLLLESPDGASVRLVDDRGDHYCDLEFAGLDRWFLVEDVWEAAGLEGLPPSREFGEWVSAMSQLLAARWPAIADAFGTSKRRATVERIDELEKQRTEEIVRGRKG